LGKPHMDMMKEHGMIKRLLFAVLLLLMLFCCPGHTKDYRGYQVFSDRQGDLYLMAPKHFMQLRKAPSIPLSVRPKNGLLKVFEEDGVWKIQVLTEAEWTLLELTEGNSQLRDLQFADLDGDGIADAFLVLRNQFTPYIILENLTGDVTLSAAQGDSMAEAMATYRLVDENGDGIAEIVSDIERFDGGSGTIGRSAFKTPGQLVVGMTTGEYRTDESGAATYQIALNIPAGIAGVQPELGFSYSSAAGDGYMGSGWSISGASAISRCPKNIASDNLQGNISFSQSDRLCLNGQRLVSGTGSSDIGVSDASYWSAVSYHTELESFVKVKPHGTTTQGPKAYTVETKSGEIHYYGDVSYVSGSDERNISMALGLLNTSGASESSADALFELNGLTTPRVWALKAIRDVKGNYILFRYAEDQLKGEHYLTEVQYTGRPSQAPFARVVFTYRDNKKKRTGYQAGHPVSLTKILDTVTVYQDNQQYRYYQFQYSESDVLEEKNYLTALQECTTNTAALCYPAVSVQWNKPASSNSGIQTVCVNGECWPEATTDSYSPISTTSVKKGSSVERVYQQLMDMNGDGYADMVYPSGGSWRVRFGNNIMSYSSEVTLSTVGVNKKEFAKTIDYNGDGQRDLLVADSATSNWFILTYQPAASTVQSCEPQLSSGYLCPDVTMSFSYNSINTGRAATGLESSAMVADIDGDGMEDILFMVNGQFKVYRNLGMTGSTHNGFSAATDAGTTVFEDGDFYDDSLPVTTGLKQSSASDVNGDGKTDVMVYVLGGLCDGATGWTRAECLYEGRVWTSLSEWKLFVSNGSSYQQSVSLGTSAKHIRPVDLNGDGYSDFMYQLGTNWYYRLSNGSTLGPVQDAMLSTPQDRIALTYFLDLNGDGRTDVLQATSYSSWSFVLSRPHSDAGKIIFESRGSYNFTANSTIQFADVNADNKLDLLTATDDRGWNIFTNSRSGINDHTVSTFTNSWGVPTAVQYSNISNNVVYFRANSSNNINSDYFSPRSGFYVVSRVRTEVKPSQWVSVDYEYGGLLLHKKGRGLLGFEHLRTTDLQTNVVTESRYYQLWPYTGMPRSSSQSRGGYVMATASNIVQNLTSAFGGSYPYISSSTENKYSLGSNLLSSTALSTIASTFVYDNYGNLSSSSVTQSDPQNSSNNLLTSTTNTFNQSAAYQRYGRLTASTVTKTLKVGGTITSNISRSSSFSYDADYLLKTETYAPNLAAATSVTTHGYDAAGNKISVSVYAPSGSDGTLPVTRTNSTAYTANYRFVASTTNAAARTAIYKYNGLAASTFAGSPALISAIAVTDANNQTSTTSFDAFGQSTSSALKGAATSDIQVNSVQSRSFCNSCNSLFPDAFIKIISTNDAGAEQEQYLDKYGREVGSRAKLPLVGYAVTRKTYDNQGRPYQSFEPAKDAVSSYKTTAGYDALGRMTTTTMPNNGVTTFSYNGYRTTTTDALSKNKTSTQNYLGQEVGITDHNGTLLSFSYNAYGDLLTASSAGVTRLSNVYDNYGRKTSMSDVDKGSWSYKTNGFGETVSQTDAKSQTTTFELNALGQLLRRYDPSGTVCWSYGNSAAAYNLDKLVTVKQWSSNQACNSATTTIYQEGYSYNSKGLVSNKTVTTEGTTFSFTSAYDSLGRPYELTYPLVNGYGGLIVRTEYSNGVAYKNTDVTGGVVGTVYQQITGFNARGQVETEVYGNGVVQNQVYDAAMGWLDNAAVSKSGVTQQSYNYDFDLVGNVTRRQISFGLLSSANMTETFGYDNLHRVTSRTVTQAFALTGNLGMTESYGYDANGNISSKTGVGHYQYNVSGKPNRLAGVWQNSNFSGTQHYNFSYDANGNITNDGKRIFAYTAFDLPSLVTQGSDTTSFSYGPNRELLKRIDARSAGTTTTLLIDNLYQQISLPSGVTEHKFMVGNAVVTRRTGEGGNDVFYLYKDQQGSTTMVTNYLGAVVQQLLYDPWGRQYQVSANVLKYSNNALTKGYTGHDMVNDFEVIHMGGRTYNPVLGRFMQADPFIQQASNLQSFNRYAYVLNNPMSYTDPSGYFFKALNKLFGKFAPLVSIAIAIYMPGLNFLQGLNAVQIGAITGFVSGGVATGSLRGALTGAISGAAFGSLHNWKSNLIAKGIDYGRIAAHGMVGGISSVLSGGKFGHGFAAAGFTQAASEIGGEKLFVEGADSLPDRAANAIKAAVIGGSASVLSGGKFGNGAITGAFSRLLNDDQVASRKEISNGKLDPKLKEAFDKAWEQSNADAVDPNLRREIGGFIGIEEDGTVGVRFWKPGSTAQIKVPMLDKTKMYEGLRVTGEFHTHPKPHPGYQSFSPDYGTEKGDISAIMSMNYSGLSFVVSRNYISTLDPHGNRKVYRRDRI